MSKFSVGQKLYMVYANRYQGDPCWVEITKVGRKWLTLKDNDRVDVETMRIDGGQYSYRGRAYLTKEEHDAELALNAAWRDFYKALPQYGGVPDGVTIDAIRKAREVLGL